MATINLLLASVLLAPAAPTSEEPQTTKELSPWRITAGYYGDVATHPGGYAGFSWRAAEAGRFSFSLGADLGSYHHRRNHTAVFLRGNFASRVTFESGILIEPRFVLGYAHTWADGDGYFVVDDEEMLRQRTPIGAPNVIYGMGLGFGFEIQEGRMAGLAFMIRPEVLGRAPYNSYALSQFSLLAGVEWRFGGRK
ncbi:MAG: hypothetical protein V3V08_19085 [Nannocystaceae bacterium]